MSNDSRPHEDHSRDPQHSPQQTPPIQVESSSEQQPEQQAQSRTETQHDAPRPAHEADYRVALDAYEGPLDLLLYLVKRNEIDLNDIPVATLAEQYLDHIREIETFDIERAGDFLVMAATLLEIKSQLLVPRVGGGEDEEQSADEQSALETGDPRYELVQQLLAYKRFKDAAMDLEDQLENWQSRYPLRPSKRKVTLEQADTTSDAVAFDMEDIDVHILCQAFARILDSIGQSSAHEVEYDDTPISLHEEDILDRLKRDAPKGGMTLQQIFVGRKNRSELIGLFLAILELTRQHKVRVIQDKVQGEIHLTLREEEESHDEDAQAHWHNPQTGEIEYDWPDEKTRRRVEDRARRRAERVGKLRRGEQVEEDDDDIIDVDEDDVKDETDFTADDTPTDNEQEDQ